MAGLTQTIPNYASGISQQPDQLKAPGQVVDTVNSIPDLINGLYKRPGAKRIGTSPLTNVQSGGSWFHYYRDETEGAYIGQVAANGRVRVWATQERTINGVTTPAGHECNVWYHTDNSAYSGSNTDHTNITTYLSASNTEDVQALTINDNTFLNNRDTDVTTTGTTDDSTDTHFAYIELLRTENGRQYGLNLYDNTNTSTLSRATRIKIASDNLDEGGNSGSCPGIGTQVFSVNQGAGTGADSANAKNLTFRITILGQQGTKPGVESINGSEDYVCSYNREITLLHGGEGYDTGDQVTALMDSPGGGADLNNNGVPDGNATYTIEVVDHETTTLTANIKAIRPAPTPFDADTAVTVDAIIGGITAEIPSGQGFTYKQIGNGLYISRTSAFNIEVVDQDLMRVVTDEINDVTKLPVQCKHGMIVKIANSKLSDEDDYYLKFVGHNNLDGTGTWIECAQPGIVKSFNANSMPHVLQRQADGDFLVKKYTWADRTVGDNNTNKIPSFSGNKINKVIFFRNRLAFLSGENIITAQPGNLTTPNFWADSALTVSAIDSIDISCSSTFPSDLYDGIEVAGGLLCFSTNEQYLFSADAEIMNPDTAKLRSVSMYNYYKTVPPIALGNTIGYIDNSNKYSRFMEMAGLAREQEAAVVNTSEVVPTLLPKDLDLIANSRENGIVLLGKTNSDEVVGYRYLNQGENRIQSAWFKWKHNNPIKWHFIIDDEYYFLDTDNFLQKINLVQADADPSIDENDVNYLIHLDNWTTVGNGSYSASTNLTTFANQSDWIDQVTSPNGSLVLIDIDSNATRVGRYAECTVTNTDDFTVPGDWSTGTFYIGYLYEYSVKFPRFYLQKSDGKSVESDINSKLTIHRAKINFGKIGLYETTLKREGKLDYTEVYESAISNQYNVSDAPYLDEETQEVPIYERNTNVELTLKSSHPAPATLRSLSWEGDYSPMHYRRV